MGLLRSGVMYAWMGPMLGSGSSPCWETGMCVPSGSSTVVAVELFVMFARIGACFVCSSVPFAAESASHGMRCVGEALMLLLCCAGGGVLDNMRGVVV